MIDNTKPLGERLMQALYEAEGGDLPTYYSHFQIHQHRQAKGALAVLNELLPVIKRAESQEQLIKTMESWMEWLSRKDPEWSPHVSR